MGYTFYPKEKFAKANIRNAKISTKNTAKLCRLIRGKKLKVAKNLLEDLVSGSRSLDGKYYTKTAKEMLRIMNSCIKNAEFLNMETEKLFVHASAHMGTIMRRRRRKGAFGSRMKTTNVEFILIEKGSSEKISLQKLKKMKSAMAKEAEEIKNKGEDIDKKTENTNTEDKKEASK
jgi:ribosomal protein L22